MNYKQGRQFHPSTHLRRRALAQYVGAAFAAIAAGSVPQLAAQEQETQLGLLEEVIVTARRREEVLQNVPIAITALSGNFLREQKITEVNNLGTYVPSLRISSGGPGSNAPLISLRGQRPSEPLLTLDPAVPMYFADVVLTPTYGTNLGLYDLENVQVLKGPQGTLFGRNSTGGALLFTPTAPGAEFGGYLDARVGNYDLYHVEGAIDLPVNDALQFRLSGRMLERDGYQKVVGDNALRGETPWDEDSHGLRLGMRLVPSDRVSNLTMISYDENDMLSRVGVPQAFNSDAPLGALFNLIHNGGLGIGGPAIDAAIERQRGRSWQDIEIDALGREKVENWLVANTTEIELTDSLRIKNVIGYRDLNMASDTDADGTPVSLIGSITSGRTTRNAPQLQIETEQFTEEFQLQGASFDDNLEWIVGAFWMKMDGTNRYPNQLIGPNPNWPAGGIGNPFLDFLAQNGIHQVSPNSEVKNESYALFGEGTYTFSPEWSLTLGIRQTWDDRHLTAGNITLNQATLQQDCAMFDENNVRLSLDNCSREVDEKFDALTWRSSVNYTPTPDMLIYGSIATGYRTGGFNERGVNDFTLQPFDEETVLTYELGHKTDWQLGNFSAMRTNLAVYFQKYDDIQKTVSGANPDTGAFETFTVNAAEAEIKGLEFDVMMALTTNLLLSMGYSYVDAEHTDWPREISPGVFLDYSRAPFLYIPEHSFTASIKYTLPLDPAIGEISLIGTAYWQDTMQTNDDPWRWPELGWSDENLQEALATTETDSYSVLNFSMDWRGVMGSGIDLSMFVNNAADEEYVTGGLSVPEDLGLVTNTHGAPRTYGASLRWNF